jgi:hypothetical protein
VQQVSRVEQRSKLVHTSDTVANASASEKKGELRELGELVWLTSGAAPHRVAWQ